MHTKKFAEPTKKKKYAPSPLPLLFQSTTSFVMKSLVNPRIHISIKINPLCKEYLRYNMVMLILLRMDKLITLCP